MDKAEAGHVLAPRPAQQRTAAPAPGRGYLWLKRALDVLLAAPALLVLSPPMACVALLVRLTSPGPALFRQERLGKDGRPFTMLKFRSMHSDGPDGIHRAAIERFLRGEPLGHDGLGRPRYKLQDDPRITPLGRVLRRTSLDELPQLWNVVRGEMSLVGPRPPLAYEVAQYEARHLARLAVVPGLTGLWQVRGRSQVSFEEMVALDLEYIARRSLALDLRIMLATLPAIIKRRGAA
jgi:lipopolysaccharide/colanic/teichoic acid biosynthesis glycosyltransferase